MKIYGIYDKNNNEQCLKIGTLLEIIKFLNFTPREWGRAIKKKNLIRGKYEVCYLFEEK